MRERYPILITNTGLTADEVTMRDPLVEIWEKWLKSKGLSQQQFLKETFLTNDDAKAILRKVTAPASGRPRKISPDDFKRAKEARDWLEKKGLSIETFARRLRMSYGTVWRWFYDKAPRKPKRTATGLIKDLFPDCPLCSE